MPKPAQGHGGAATEPVVSVTYVNFDAHAAFHLRDRFIGNLGTEDDESLADVIADQRRKLEQETGRDETE